MVPTVTVTTIHRSDDEVYAVTRVIFENRQELAPVLRDAAIFIRKQSFAASKFHCIQRPSASGRSRD